MKNLLVIALFLSGFNFSNAQDYLTGKLIDNQGQTREINYDRTENAIGINVFQSYYKVLSKKGNILYNITITHDQLRSMIMVAVKTEGSDVKGAVIEYDENECGLIFSDISNVDTVFNLSSPYKYLLSFTDVNRDYPVLHKIQTGTGVQIVLDPLSKFCLRKHNEIVKSHRVTAYIAQKKQKMEEESSDNDGNQYKGELWGDKNGSSGKKGNSFTAQLLKLRDSLYIKNNLYNQSITALRAGIDKDVKTLLKQSHLRDDEKKYAGEKRRGKPEGKGLQVDNGNVYDGKFESGVFVSGTTIIKEDSSEYCGQFSNDFENGTGVLRYKNGGYLLGKFKNGRLNDGIILAKDKGGEVFFGNYLYNQRTGYGELRGTQGNCYYGEFRNGRLVKGYSKEVDQFGYSTYSKIDNGIKKAIEPQLAESFFAEVLSFKK